MLQRTFIGSEDWNNNFFVSTMIKKCPWTNKNRTANITKKRHEIRAKAKLRITHVNIMGFKLLFTGFTIRLNKYIYSSLFFSLLLFVSPFLLQNIIFFVYMRFKYMTMKKLWAKRIEHRTHTHIVENKKATALLWNKILERNEILSKDKKKQQQYYRFFSW